MPPRSEATEAAGVDEGRFVPSPVLDRLRQAGALLAGPAVELVDVIANGYPRSLERRPAQLVRAAGARVEDLNRLLTGAGFADLEDVRRQATDEGGHPVIGRELRYTSRVGTEGERPGLEATLALEQHNLAQTMNHLQNSGALELAARAVLVSRRRWVFGDLKSRGYAQLFAADLTAALNNVTLVDPTAASVLAALADAHRLDSVTVFSFRRYSRLTVRFARQFADIGATVIAVTDSEDSPVCEFADHVLRVVTRSDTPTHSPTAVTAIGHILATLTAAGAKGASRRAEHTRALAASMDWYEQEWEPS